MNKYVLKRHKFYNHLIKPFLSIYAKIFLKFNYFKCSELEKDENFIVISNHEHVIDSALLSLSFKQPIYFVINDYFNNKSFKSKLLFRCFNPIPCTKDANNYKSVKKAIEYTKENGSIGIFPSGKIEYFEINTKVDLNLVKLVKKLNLPLVIYNFKNLIYRNLRYSYQKNKIKSYGYVRKIIYPSEYNNYTNEDLQEIINENLIIYNRESKLNCTIKNRAEYLEKVLFVCPECNKLNSLRSNENHLYCDNCNLDLYIDENYNIKINNKDYKYLKLNELMDYQNNFINNNNVDYDFKDSNITLSLHNPNEKAKEISKGDLTLKNNVLSLDKYNFDINKIESISTILKNSLRIVYENNHYLFSGKNRFNSYKYKLLVEKLKTEKK